VAIEIPNYDSNYNKYFETKTSSYFVLEQDTLFLRSLNHNTLSFEYKTLPISVIIPIDSIVERTAENSFNVKVHHKIKVLKHGAIK
jgi:hypothetical protein